MNTTLRLDGELAIQQAAVQRERLLAWVAETDPARADGTDGADATSPTLDLSAVEAFDSAGVQLLLALRHTLANRGQVLQVGPAAAVVRDALLCYGLGSLLNGAAAA